MPGLPIPTFASPPLPDRTIGTLPTSAPTAGVKSVAHGKVGVYGMASIEVSGACEITLYFWSPASTTWRLPGEDENNTYTFAAAGIHYFFAQPGTHFYIQSDTGSITGYTDAEAFAH